MSVGLGGEKVLIFALSPAHMDTGHWLIPFSMTIPHFDVLTNPQACGQDALTVESRFKGQDFFFNHSNSGCKQGRFLPLNLIFPACQVNSNNTYLEDELGLNGIKQEVACESIHCNINCGQWSTVNTPLQKVDSMEAQSALVPWGFCSALQGFSLLLKDGGLPQICLFKAD